jgi:hypothetical protein
MLGFVHYTNDVYDMRAPSETQSADRGARSKRRMAGRPRSPGKMDDGEC